MGWNMNLDYVQAYKRIYEKLSEAKHPMTKRNCIILLVQLRNGLRVSEAIEVCKKMAQEKTTVVEVQVKKYRGKPVYRKAVLPKCVPVSLMASFNYNTDQKTMSHFCKRVFGWNTHSLRYAYITYLSMRGIVPNLIAKITMHSDHSNITRYTEEAVAEKILQEIGDIR